MSAAAIWKDKRSRKGGYFCVKTDLYLIPVALQIGSLTALRVHLYRVLLHVLSAWRNQR